MDKREKLITDNFGLVHSCVSRFKGRGLEYDDLFQIGCIGLIKAADGFDESRGVMFSTYAVPTILGEIKRIFRDTGAVKVSRSLKELAFKVLAEKERLEKTSESDVNVNLIAENLGIEPVEVSEALCAMQPVLSLTAYNEDGETQIELPAENKENEINDRLYIDELLLTLSEKEKNIIKLRYYCNKTQTETAKILDMTQVQVSRSEKKILKKLRCAD